MRFKRVAMSFLRLFGYIIIVLVFNLAGLIFVCFLESRRVQAEGGSSFLASLWHLFAGVVKFIIAILLIILAFYSFSRWNPSDKPNTAQSTNSAKSKPTQKQTQKQADKQDEKKADPLSKLESSELRAMWEVSAHDEDLRKRIDKILIERTRKQINK